MSLGITGIAVTVVEGDQAVGLDPRKGWDGVVAILFDDWWRLSMAEVASNAPLAAAGRWSRKRRSEPCLAAQLSQGSWCRGVRVVDSAPALLLVVAHGRGALDFYPRVAPVRFE